MATRFNIAVYNVRGIYSRRGKEKKLKERKVNIAAISKTKKKLKGCKELGDCIMYYSGVCQEKRAATGIACSSSNRE